MFTAVKVKKAMPAFKEERFQTSNVSGRMIRPRGIVFHHSCGTWEGDTAWILNPASKVSYHCLINSKGERRVFAGDTQRAWHAGKSIWRGKPDCNSWMLGVAFSGDTYPDRKFGRLLTGIEIRSALDWLAPRIEEWEISLDMITDHRNVSPGRKDDLNPTQWLRLRDRIWTRFYR